MLWSSHRLNSGASLEPLGEGGVVGQGAGWHHLGQKESARHKVLGVQGFAAGWPDKDLSHA